MTTHDNSLADLTGQYTLDPTHSGIGFVARHAMVTKVRGSFKHFEGTGYLDGTDPANSKIDVTIEAKSIDTGNEERDQHLRSNDFFDMAKYPEIKFVSTAARQIDPDTFELTGDLTMKGVTKPVTIPFTYEGAVKDPWGNCRLGFEGSAAINRKDWGVSWNAAMETGGMLVSEKVTLVFDLSVIRNH